MRRCAAVIAAYALALQAMFSAFAVPAPHGIVPAFERCAADGDRAREPAHQSCSACLAGHCAGAAASPLRIAVILSWPVTATSVPAALAAAALQPLSQRHGPHSPRAPPLG